MLLAVFAAAALLLASSLPSAQATWIPLTVLILTSPGFTSIDFLETVMQGYGTPYNVVRVDPSASPPLNLTTLLWGPSGNAPQYGGIVAYPNLEAMGYFNASDVQTLWAYQRINGVRTVKFGAWPTNFGFDVDVSACSTAGAAMVFSPGAPLGVSGINPSVQLSSDGLWRCPGVKAAPLTTCSIWAADFAATGLHPPCKAAPLLEFAGTGYVAAIQTTFADGRESLGFTFDCALWSTTCVLLGHQALAWLLHDVIPGERLALLTVHTDDVMLSTWFDRYAPPTPSGATSYRLTAADLQAHADWLAAVNARLPPGSNLRIELPFVGQGILQTTAKAMQLMGLTASSPPLNISDKGCLDVADYYALGCSCWFVGMEACPLDAPSFCRNCTKEWPKPAGFGENRVPADALASAANWNLTEFTTYDDLAASIVQPNATGSGASSSFYWSHHTWSHENLDNATASDAALQLLLNRKMADTLGLSNRTTFSSKCMVTPQISGLQNADALAALAANGVTCATGDNTWNFLVNHDSPHQMLDALVYPSFKILPRWASEIYYNCSTTAQNLRVYNNLYSSTFGGPSTFDQLLQREASRVVREGLLKMRKDPFMMHQANLALIEGTGASLLMRWVDAVLAEFGRFVAWPVASLKLDDLMAAFQARKSRDDCKLSYTLTVGNGTVSSVGVASAGGSGTCSAPLLSAAGQTYVSVAAGGSASVAAPSGLGWGLLYSA